MTIYMIGIAGVGMTALAQALKGWGHEVSGSDDGASYFTLGILKRASIPVAQGFDPGNVPSAADLVIYSTAYNEEHPERVRARALGLKAQPYAEALGFFSSQKRCLAIAGTHGKTTTTAMVGRLLEEAGLDPTVIVGSTVLEWGSNARVGKGDWMVIEADEYQNKLQYYRPEGVVLTSIDWDHPDFFPDEASYRETFRSFLERLAPHAWVVAGADDVDVAQLLYGLGRAVKTYGWGAHRELRGHNRRRNFSVQSFEAADGVECCGTFSLSVAGVHNASNALATIGVASMMGIPLEIVRRVLGSFRGTHRRCERLGEMNGITIVDDYAHHPKEIQASLAALREQYPGQRLVCVFQPHTYSRTKALLNDFAFAFGDADVALITDIYASARETEQTMSSDAFALAMAHHPDARYVPREMLLSTLEALVEPNDCLVTMGAGDIREVAEEWMEQRRRGNEDRDREIGGLVIPGVAAEENVPLAPLTTFRIGGPARYLVRIKNSSDLEAAMRAASQAHMPVFVLGGGCNVVVGECGFDGLVITMEDRTLKIDGETVVASAGVPLNYLATQCARQGLFGAEFLFTIPGTVGGAVRGNAGAFGSEMKDIVKSVRFWNGEQLRQLEESACEFGYRTSIFKERQHAEEAPQWIIVEATFHLKRGDPAAVNKRMQEFAARKAATQQLEYPSAGCLFTNVEISQGFWAELSHRRWRDRVPQEFLERGRIPAAWLIDQLDLKGFHVGRAMVSTKHANYVVNIGGATAEDIIMLASIIKQKVRVAFGVQLREEVEMVGI